MIDVKFRIKQLLGVPIYLQKMVLVDVADVEKGENGTSSLKEYQTYTDDEYFEPLNDNEKVFFMIRKADKSKLYIQTLSPYFYKIDYNA